MSYIEQVGATRALHVSNPFFLFVSVFSSLSLPLPRLLLSALIYLSFFLSANLPHPRPPTACMPSLSLSLFLRLKICAPLDIYIGDKVRLG